MKILLPALGISAGFAVLLAGCAAPQVQSEPPTVATPFEFTPEQEPKMFAGFLPDPKTRFPVPWLMEDRNGLAVIEGDIVIGTVEEAKSQDAAKSLQYLKERLWTGGQVPYILAADFPNRAVVLAALGEYHRLTGIRFLERTTQANFLRFTVTDNSNVGGQSFYGMRGGDQPIWLNRDTSEWSRGTVMHELAHALCVAHEQCRSDRDTFVRINFDHVIDGYKSQFSQLFSDGRDVGTYDYASIMHYPPLAFSKNNRPTIVPLQRGVRIGQREILSAGDIAGIADIYAAELATASPNGGR